VPNVVGQTQGAATVAITGANLIVGAVTTAHSPTVLAGNVISQTPAAGTQVAPRSAVDFVVSLGPEFIPVPDVVGLAQAEAEDAITGAGLAVGAVTTAPSPTVPAGAVVSQSPVAGTMVTAGTAVDLVVSLGASDITPPLVTITEPADGSVFSRTSITVAGTVDDAMVSVMVNGVAASLTAGTPTTFTAEVPLREGNNFITAAAMDAAGNMGTASVRVTRDTHPPLINLETPRDGAILTSLQADVAGFVNDIVTGTTINPDDCQVFVNGQQAALSNRAFLMPGLLLQRGQNTITVEALDRVGNRSSTSIQVTVQDQSGQRIVLLSGNNQTAIIGTQLPDPLVVELIDAQGSPVANRPVTFMVSRGEGQVQAFPEVGSSVTVQTDAQGLASALFTLGDRIGAGNHRVTATAVGFVGQADFCATATNSPPERITTTAGDGQVGVAGQPLPRPFLALVTDTGGNPVGGVEVTFTVTQGGGHFAGNPSLTQMTDLDGLVRAILTLGTQEGINNNVVSATFPGLAGSPTTFTASGRVAGQAAQTTVSGVVLDNQDMPLPGVTVHLEVPGVVLNPVPMAVTNDQGQFTITGAPVGAVRLVVDGSTATRPGEWPMLDLDLITIAGQDNTFGRPIYLPIVDTESAKLVGGNQDVTLRMKNVPGTELTVFANSVTCLDGSPQCQIMWSQVNLEKVPMPPPMGSSFMLAWTLQPPGVHFNPPARVCIPNMGSPPGHQVEMFQFDHELGEFVAIGTATVTPDGSQMCSDPGFGIFAAGWGGCVPPPPPCSPVCRSTTCSMGQQQGCSCTFVPVNDGGSCDDQDKCTVDDMCQGGSCKGQKVEVRITEAPATICVGNTKTVRAMTMPAGRSITWQSSSSNILSISGGGASASITGVAKGISLITAQDSATQCSSDSRNIQVIDMDEFGGPTERAFCAAVGLLSTPLAISCAEAYRLARQVQSWEMQTFSSACRGEGSPGDAARHARWSCELHSSFITRPIADQILRRHENRPNDPCTSHEQDLNNNEMGRQNAEAGRDCTSTALSDLSAGRLQVNNPPPGVTCP